MKGLEKLLNQILSNLDQIETENLAVSKSTVGWQLDHSARVICSIGKALIKSDPKEYKRKTTWTWIVVKALNYIPRGKGNAPKVTLNPEPISKSEIEKLIIDAESIWQRVESLDKNAFFNHPFFGNLKVAEAKKFIAIHTKHHLKIVRDILRK